MWPRRPGANSRRPSPDASREPWRGPWRRAGPSGADVYVVVVDRQAVAVELELDRVAADVRDHVVVDVRVVPAPGRQVDRLGEVVEAVVAVRVVVARVADDAERVGVVEGVVVD